MGYKTLGAKTHAPVLFSNKKERKNCSVLTPSMSWNTFLSLRFPLLLLSWSNNNIKRRLFSPICLVHALVLLWPPLSRDYSHLTWLISHVRGSSINQRVIHTWTKSKREKNPIFIPTPIHYAKQWLQDKEKISTKEGTTN